MGRTCGTDWTRLRARCSARLFGRAGRIVCLCRGGGGDHVDSDDLREKRVECACVCARACMCVCACARGQMRVCGAWVPAWRWRIVFLCASALLVRACVPANACTRACVHLALHLSRLLFHPSLPLTSPIPSIHSSSQPASSSFVHLSGSVPPSLCNLSFFLFRRREPKPNLALAGQPVPRVRQTKARVDSHTCRQTLLARKGALSHTPSLLPPSDPGPGAISAPAAPWSPGSVLFSEAGSRVPLATWRAS